MSDSVQIALITVLSTVITTVGAIIPVIITNRKTTVKAVEEKIEKNNEETKRKFGEFDKKFENIEKRFDSVDSRFEEAKTQVGDVSEELKKHVIEDKAGEMKQRRMRIIRFSDEIDLGTRHSKGHFEEVIEDIDEYEAYCKANPNYPNHKAQSAIRNVLDTYEKCRENKTFL